MSYALFRGHLVIVSSSTYNQLREVLSILHIIAIQGELTFSCTARMVDDKIIEIYDDTNEWLSLHLEGIEVFDYILGETFVYDRECAINECTLLNDRDVFSCAATAKISVYG